jgi:hypothetical protein
MKTRIETEEVEKTLNEDRFGFSKELSRRRGVKPKLTLTKNFVTGKDRDGGKPMGQTTGGLSSPDAAEKV